MILLFHSIFFFLLQYICSNTFSPCGLGFPSFRFLLNLLLQLFLGLLVCFNFFSVFYLQVFKSGEGKALSLNETSGDKTILYLLAIKYLLMHTYYDKYSWLPALAFPKTLFLLSLKSESSKYLYKIIFLL